MVFGWALIKDALSYPESDIRFDKSYTNTEVDVITNQSEKEPFRAENRVVTNRCLCYEVTWFVHKENMTPRSLVNRPPALLRGLRDDKTR
jgi:hypothetical protein